MRHPSAGYRRSTGAALLIILVLITILSILLIAYLGTVQFEKTTTQNYSGKISADQIAMGGLDRVVTDLNQEIQAGSTANAGPNSTSLTYYKPVTPNSMVPASYNDTGYAYTNLIRVSASNNTFYASAYPNSAYPGPYPVNLAIGSSTATKSSDGRYLSAVRWQAPQLLLPGETNAVVMPVPDWILMTRIGPTNATGINFGSTGNTLNNPASSNPNNVVGRYAYMVYDEGGLLDATVAGVTNSGTGAPTPDDIGNRGSLALALLTNSVLTPAQMSALSGWRNAATDATETAYTNYVYGIGATNGLLHVQPGDNTFLSRQDLISYANYAGLTSALPYLGTFNRSLNAPAYTPANPTMTNPDLLTLRFANSGTINSSPPTGALLQSRTVQAGDFLLTRRFPLSRLSWVGYGGVANGATAYDVWRAFGLVYSTSNNAWVYVSAAGSTLPNGSTPATTIKTLTAVAQETPPRDPDFFELLQAGILKGSLGQNGGAENTFTNGIIYFYGGSGDTYGYDRVPSYQIIQIGINIIDQARADSFPTAASFGPDPADEYVNQTNGAPTTPFSGPRTFYGVKNLPYISRIADTFVRWKTPPSPLSNGDILTNNPPFAGTNYLQPYVGCWEQVELWNPHQTTSTSPNTSSSTLYPTGLRIAAAGKVHGIVYSRQTTTSTEYDADTYAPGKGPDASPRSAPGEATWTFASTFIQLTAGGMADFSEPSMIPPADVASSTASCVPAATNVDGGGLYGTNGTSFVGLYVGSSYAPDWVYSGTNAAPKTRYPTATNMASATYDPALVTYNTARINPFTSVGSANFGVTYEMQYLAPDGTWRPYGPVKAQTFEDDTTIPSTANTTNVPTWTLVNSNANARFDQGIDPRTDRFSMSKGREGFDVGVNPISTLINNTMRPDAGIGYSSDGSIPYGNWYTTNSSGGTVSLAPPTPYTAPYYLGGIAENTTNSTFYYRDPDNVLRRGDSAYNNVANTSTAGVDGHPGIKNGNFSLGVNLARPVFLNRPFRSVGELGYVGRDIPWKTLDFFTKDSGDAPLLDLFSVSDADVLAGTINLNTRNAQALAEAIGGGAINPNHPADTIASPLSSTQAATLANAFITATKTRPLQSRAEMVTTALDPTTGETVLTTAAGVFPGQSAKTQREAPIRALAEVGNTRTWNLLVDIIAQSGRYPANLPAGSSYDSFIPDGEKRYWLHIAIDRYTGRVIDRFLEPVQE